MQVTPLVWTVTIVVIAVLFFIDLAVIGRRPHEPSRREVTFALGGFIGLAILFGLGVWYAWGPQYGTEFFAGWLTEYSLSIDNLFVFILLMASFDVPRKYQQTALMIGIVLAIVLRGAFIALGAAAIQAFSWVFYLFGVFLIYTAIKLIADFGEAEEYETNALLRWATKRLPATLDWHGTKLWVKRNRRWLVTPMFFVVIALGTVDILFALDSIPAIFGLTEEPYLVFTANVFALMGLRQLYFLIGGLLERLIYLSIGLALLLVFIGAKLIIHALHTNDLGFLNSGEPITLIPEIPTGASIASIVLILAVTAIVSLAVSAKRARQAHDD